jgi:rhodanese-related sulfurtransferase
MAMSTTVKDMLAEAHKRIPSITPAQAADMMKAGEVLVVDVRDAPEVQQSGKVKGAVNVSRGLLEFRADPESPMHHPDFQKDKTVILYCASGGRSALAGQMLMELGYAKVYNLGGFKGWAEAGLPVEPA